MMERTIVGSIHNGGDGSVNVQWFSSKELAEWDQEHLDEGWGETCTTTVTVTGTDIKITEPDDVCNPTMYLVRLLRQQAGSRYESAHFKQVDDFIKTFFPNGVPLISLMRVGTSYVVAVEGIMADTIESGTMRMWDLDLSTGDEATNAQLTALEAELNTRLAPYRKAKVAVHDPVHSEEGKWYFWDETWASRFGPYPDEPKAREMLNKYVEQLHGEEIEPK